MIEPTLHPRKQFLFAVLSGADFALTWWLIEQTDGQAYEANPVAAWWLARFGWLGLACFKAAVVCLILGLTSIISRFRPQVAGRVLALGCLCLVAVVSYSAALGGTTHWGREDAVTANARIYAEVQECNREIHDENRKKELMRALLRQLEDEILAQRCTLREAAGRLQAHEGQNPQRLRVLAAQYPDVPVEQRFACWLICRVVHSHRNDAPAARILALRLAGEFQSGYGARPPLSLRSQVGALWLDGSEPTESESLVSRGSELVRLP